MWDFRKFVATLVVLTVVAAPASAQQTCSESVTCPGNIVATGEFPDCSCPEPEPPPLAPPTCEANFACVDGQQLGFGEWPDCSCRDLETPLPAPGERPAPDPGVTPGLGMEETCTMFFQCPHGFQMIVWNGKCVCGDEMLPPPEQ